MSRWALRSTQPTDAIVPLARRVGGSAADAARRAADGYGRSPRRPRKQYPHPCRHWPLGRS